MESLKVQFHQRLSASGMPAVIQQGVLAHWQQFADRHPPCTDQPVKAEAVDQLIRCWAGSDFVAEQCLNHPLWLTSLLANHEHLAMLAHNHVERLRDALAAVDDEQALMLALRRHRNQEMVRIIWLDLNRRVTMPETTADLSALADACIDAALNWLYQDCCQTLGTPYGTDIPDEAPWPQQMVVLGMGKLGAGDLNLSSDIDLILAYPCQGGDPGQQKSADLPGIFSAPRAAADPRAGQPECGWFCLPG